MAIDTTTPPRVIIDERGLRVTRDPNAIPTNGNGHVIDVTKAETKIYKGGALQIQQDPKMFAAQLSSVSELFDHTDEMFKSAISGSHGNSMFSGKRLKNPDGTFQTFSAGSMMPEEFGAIMPTPVLSEGQPAAVMSASFRLSSGSLAIGDTHNQAAQNYISLHRTGTTAGATPAGGSTGVNANPVTGGVFLFTDGSDLFIKLANGTVKKVTSE